MTVPVILFGLIIAAFVGGVFHLLRGGDGWRLLLDMALSMIGFALGQWLDDYSGLTLFTFGALEIGVGVILSILFLLGADIYLRFRKRNRTGV